MPAIQILSSDPATVNRGILCGSERALLIDAGQGPDSAEVLLSTLDTVSGAEADLPFDVLITHDHWDHFFGASALVTGGAEHVYTSLAFAQDQVGSTWLALDSIGRDVGLAEFAGSLPTDPRDLIVETTSIETGTSLDLGDLVVEFHVLAGHSTADVIVRVPEHGIVFTGDLLEEGAPPQAGEDASLTDWVNSLTTLLDFPEAQIFVPGHGVPVDRDFVTRQREDLQGFRAMQGQTGVALPSRSMPGSPDRALPRTTVLL